MTIKLVISPITPLAVATTVVMPFISAPASLAQSTSPSEPRIQISPAALAEIREAPFSEVFDIGDARAFAIKDQDYNPSEPDIGFFSLWADVPELDRFALVVKYCFDDTSLAQANAELVSVTLSDGDTQLVTIDQVIESRPSYLNEVRPPRRSNVSTSFYYNPFYDPYYYSPFRFGLSYAPPTYIPGVECSMGLAFFDLMPVQDEIATLPDTTLNARLLFSDGKTENWRLGSGTVRALKTLPTLAPLQ